MFSVSPYLLLVARSLQGISAAAVFVVGFAMVADNVEKERIAQSMGYASVAMTVGNLLGPAIGGITCALSFCSYALQLPDCLTVMISSVTTESLFCLSPLSFWTSLCDLP